MKAIDKLLQVGTWIAFGLFIVFMVRTCGNTADMNYKEDRSLLVNDSLIQVVVDLYGELDSITELYEDSLANIPTKTFTQIKTIFDTIYGPADTVYQPTIVIDSSQAVACIENKIRLDSNRAALKVVVEQRQALDTANTLLVQANEECSKERELWRKHDATPRWRLIKRCRLKKRAKKIAGL